MSRIAFRSASGGVGVGGARRGLLQVGTTGRGEVEQLVGCVDRIGAVARGNGGLVPDVGGELGLIDVAVGVEDAEAVGIHELRFCQRASVAVTLGRGEVRGRTDTLHANVQVSIGHLECQIHAVLVQIAELGVASTAVGLPVLLDAAARDGAEAEDQ